MPEPGASEVSSLDNKRTCFNQLAQFRLNFVHSAGVML